jgi:hypothetical protein
MPRVHLTAPVRGDRERVQRSQPSGTERRSIAVLESFASAAIAATRAAREAEDDDDDEDEEDEEEEEEEEQEAVVVVAEEVTRGDSAGRGCSRFAASSRMRCNTLRTVPAAAQPHCFAPSNVAATRREPTADTHADTRDTGVRPGGYGSSTTDWR